MEKIIALLIMFTPLLSSPQGNNNPEQLLYHKKYTSAEALVKQQLQANPAATDNWYWLSQTLLQKNDSMGLVNMYTALPAGNDVWVSIARGIAFLQSGNTSAARQQFDNAISETRGKDPNVLKAVARANIYSPNGDKNYALEQLARSIKRSKKDPVNYFLKGEAYMRLRNGNEAYTAYNEALRLNEKFAPALYALGNIFSTQQNEEMYLQYYNKTLAVDPTYAPALYDLYLHYYNKDVNKAYGYYQQYLQNTDVDETDEYQLADLLYLTKQYDASVRKVNTLLQQNDAKNRLNKLLGYIYKEKGNADSSLFYMNRYFTNGADSDYLVKDYAFMIDMYDSLGTNDSVIVYYEKLLPLIKDPKQQTAYYKKIADIYSKQKDYKDQAVWLEKYYNTNPNATNLDLFNLGVAYFQSQQYTNSDSIFVKYVEKYPDQVFGYYWQARSKAAIDTSMQQGLAIPVYKKVIEVIGSDTASATNKRYLVEAYGYLAAYTVNEEKNYAGAIEYFEKLLTIDPDNADAKRYIEILRKAVATD